MRIGIVTPAPARSRYGNRVTAIRWARILRRLGHRVTIQQTYDGERLDLLIALHARRSYASIERFHRERPGSKIIVALTGTDLYPDLNRDRRAPKSLDLATRIVVLQPKALDDLRASWRKKTRVILQSAAAPARRPLRTTDAFNVCVIGHLRPVKDPFRAAMAARLLRASSRVRIVQVGGAMNERAATRAREEERVNPRYRWLGEMPAWRVRRVFAECRACVLSSRTEGGANVLGEAIVAGVPVLASRIAGSVGILGENYPGYFEAGDTDGLAALLARAETDGGFLRELRRRCEKLAPLFDPAREEDAWGSLLDEISASVDP